MKRALFERQHLAGVCPCALRTDAERDSGTQALIDDLQSLDGTLAIRAIYGDHVHMAHPKSKDRRVEQFLFRDHPHAAPSESEKRRGVEIRLMIRHEHIGLIRMEMFPAGHVDFDPR